MVCFLPDFFLLIVLWGDDFHLKHRNIYISFQDEQTYENSIIVSPFYLSGRNFLYGFLPSFRGFFHVIFGVSFLIEYS